MTGDGVIDTKFDVRSDARGKDPDSHSATLRRFHRLLWSKPLPKGTQFVLDEDLHHASHLGEFWLSSDSIVHTYLAWTHHGPLADAIRDIPGSERDHFYELAHTVGGYLVFPCNSIYEGGKCRQSINQARGSHPRIRDRFDLTLECIRRHYDQVESPLSDVLARYSDFFRLFEDFHGYVDHFLLNDLVSEDYRSVRFLKEFDEFLGSALPDSSPSEYREYMTRAIDFINARNARIAKVRFNNSES